MGCTRALGLSVVVCLLAGTGFGGDAPPRKEKEKTPADWKRIAEGSGYMEDRDDAVRKLGEVRDERLVEMYGIVNFLMGVAQKKDSHPRLRDSSIRSLGNLALHTKVSMKDRFISKFADIVRDKDEDPNIRYAVLQVFESVLDFQELKDEKAIQSVEQIAGDKRQDLWIRLAAFDCMGQVGISENGFKVLAANLREGEPELKVAILGALLRRMEEAEKLLDVPTVDVLIRIMKDKEIRAESRVAAMKVVALNGARGGPGKKATEDIMGIMRDKDETQAKVVAGAIDALGQLGDPKALDVMLDVSTETFFADDAGVPVRRAICAAMGNYFLAYEKKDKATAKTVGEKCRDRLIKYLTKEKSQIVKKTAIWNMSLMAAEIYGPLKPPAVDELLNELYSNDSPEMKDAIVEALRYLTRQNHGTNVERWDEWFKTWSGGAPKERKPAPKKPPGP